MSQSESVLEKYLPKDSLELVMPLLRDAPVELKIKAPRKTKFGDYRFPKNGERHKISINSNLNSFAFLITLLHEIAHLQAFLQFGRTIKPHGKEWQQTFIDVSEPFLKKNIFPESLSLVLKKSLNQGNASSCTDLNLYRELQKYDAQENLYVEDLEHGTVFIAANNVTFKKGPKARKRYKCLNLDNGREYMVHPLAVVKLIQNEIQSV